MKRQYDFLIIGGGVVGSALARELSAYQLSIAVLEKNRDVVFEGSGRNSGVAHAGFAMAPGMLKTRLCVEGNQMMEQLSRELDFRFKRTGKVLVGFTEADRLQLEKQKKQGETNGVKGLRIVEKEELKALCPEAEGNFALYSPESGILDPFGLTIGLAECAAKNGAHYYFAHEVRSISRENGLYRVSAGEDEFEARWIINAAGAYADRVAALMGVTDYHMICSKGDYIILDQHAGQYLNMPIYPVPSNITYGTHVTPTIDGNVLIGPTISSAEDPEYYGVSRSIMDFMEADGQKIWPHVQRKDFIRNHSGLIPKIVEADGVAGRDFAVEIREDIAPHAVQLVGICSPGLTASVPLARYVIELIQQEEKLLPNPSYDPTRKAITHFAECSPEEQAELIQKDPDYGELVCRCEKVSRAEILQAIHNPLGAATMLSVKYRTRCMMGRCQGGYCQMRIAELLENELGLKPEEILYARDGSELFTGKLREE